MIVIAIIGLLIGVATIGWRLAQQSGNENSAIQQIGQLRTFQADFANKNRGQFATFDELIQKSGLDEKFAGEQPVVNGYIYKMTIVKGSAATPPFYSVSAEPQQADGRRFYFDSNLSTIKATDESRPATKDDQSI